MSISVSRTDKPGLNTRFFNSDNSDISELAKSVDESIGVGYAIQDEQGRLVTIRYNSRENCLQAFRSGRWVKVNK